MTMDTRPSLLSRPGCPPGSARQKRPLPGTLPRHPLHNEATALVLGGGVSGMTAALDLAERGFPVHLVEKSARLCGFARHLDNTWRNQTLHPKLVDINQRVMFHDRITLHLESTVTAVERSGQGFRTTLKRRNGRTRYVWHDVGILAIGGRRFQPMGQYGYGTCPGVYTNIEFDVARRMGDRKALEASSVLYIQCVGSLEKQRPYCSAVCCTQSIEAAIRLKEQAPGRQVTILYRAIRCANGHDLYQKARHLGVEFIEYQLRDRPQVATGSDGVLIVTLPRQGQNGPITLTADAVVLAEAIIANPEGAVLAPLFGLTPDRYGFVRTPSQDMFSAGLIHHPQTLQDAVTHALQTSAQAASALQHKTAMAGLPGNAGNRIQI
jgi:heterodisulfide reductase subunit A2